MNTVNTKKQLAELFMATGKSHHAAFEATDGVDPDWSIWYADHLKDPLAQQLHMDFHKSQLIYRLMNADIEHQARAPDSNWPDFYADQFIEGHAPSVSPEDDKPALYHFNGCPFCAIAKSAIERLGVDVELRDIYESLGSINYYNELIDALGRATVPVLRITSADGEESWMPESRDIVSYLDKTYA